jgi:pimeloyl-ACP methyl ester carboxylesterase
MTLPAFVEQGQGHVVLLLHGIGGSKAIWGESLGALAAAGYRAVAMDFPGYGDSSGTPTLQAMVDAVHVMLDHLGAERNALAGHSMGGMVAQELVATAPRRVQALVLACTSSAFGKPDGDWQARFVADRLAPLDAGLGMAGMAAKLVPGMVAPGTVAAALEVSMAVMARVPEVTYRSALRAIAAFDRRAALAEIRIPALCLAGEHDRTAPPDVMLRMAQRIAGGEYRCLSDAGHIANVEQPEEFNAAVIEFLRRALP